MRVAPQHRRENELTASFGDGALAVRFRARGGERIDEFFQREPKLARQRVWIRPAEEARDEANTTERFQERAVLRARFHALLHQLDNDDGLDAADLRRDELQGGGEIG